MWFWIFLALFVGLALLLIFKLPLPESMTDEDAKNAYEAALDHLAEHPEDPKARVACLSAGREHYKREHQKRVGGALLGGAIIGTPPFNAATALGARNTAEAAAEAKIMSDMEVRVGHLKYADRA